MDNKNPYDEGIFPDQSAPSVAPAVNPYDVLPTPLGPDTSAITKAADQPYSTFNTVGRMATDALFGIPDTITGIQRGMKYGFNRGLDYLTGETPPSAQPQPAIPYIAPIARKATGIAELPEDTGIGRMLAEGGGSALIGGLGSAGARGLVRGAQAVPEMASILNPWRPIKNVTEDALEKSGNNWYNALDNLDVRYTPQTGPNMATAIDRGAFKPRGISDANAGQALSNVDQLRTIDPAANVPYGTTKDYIVPRDIEGVRQALNRTRSQAAVLPGHREGEAANVAIAGIDRFLENPPASAIHPSNVNDPTLVGPVLANARGDTAAAHRLGFLAGTRDEIGTKFAAKPTASASNEAQALRDRSAAALNASRAGGGPLYGFNDYERQLLEKASNASWLARYGANAPRSLTGLMVQAAPAGFGSHMMGLPPSVTAAAAAALPVSEYAAKKLADWGTRRAYDRAAEAIAARSPLAQGMGIPAPPTARLLGSPFVSRDNIAAALMAPSAMRQPFMPPPITVEEQQ
jgi:hypothetical protein